MVLLKGSRSVAKFRCEVRQQILPPLKDVINRPEQGNTLRNKLCRLLTTPNVSLRDLVAELLFVLCKENGTSGCIFLLCLKCECYSISCKFQWVV